MSEVTQISVKVNADYSALESNDIIYVDTVDDVVEITLGTPLGADKILIQDLGNASSNNINLVSTQLINGANGFTIDKDFALLELTYEPIEGFYTAKVLKGYRVVNSNTTLDGSEDVIFIDSSGGAFTLTLYDNPITLDETYVVDYTGFCGTNAVTVDGNGKQIIGFDNALMNLNFIGYNFTYNGTQHNI